MNILMLGPDNRNKAIIDFLKSEGNFVTNTTEEVTLNFLQHNNIEFLISSGYAPILKEPIISTYRHKIINLHISYLPYGKGIAPNFWSFFESTPNGITIHFIDSDIDSGEIIFQKSMDFDQNETLENYFMIHWQSIIDNDIEPVLQKNLAEKGTYHNRLESEAFLDLLPLRWQTPVSQVQELGVDFRLSRNFWDIYDQSVNQAID